MTIFVAVDDKMGVMFNKRRQSRDEEVCRKIVELSGNDRLLMNEYSKKLFSSYDKNITVSDSFLEDAREGDFCFLEGAIPESVYDKTQKLILFRWNRHYPSDVTLDIDFNDWTMVNFVEFSGKSHEKITMEEYRRNIE